MKRKKIRKVEHIPKHCDDYIDDETQPKCLRVWLARAREPAHGMTNPDPWPECYAMWQGKKVRLTMASRLGSVGWDEDLNRTEGYTHRGFLEDLTGFTPFRDRAALKAYVEKVIDMASEEMKRKRDAGICTDPECNKPALKDDSVYFFGDDHCEEHAKKAELECLIDDQKDDMRGKLP